MRAVILGGGIAGLTAGIGLARAGVDTTVLEASPAPGGLASGFREDGYTFDLVSHRLWTRDEEVLGLVHQWASDGLVTRRKISRILLDGAFYNYPIDLRDVLSGHSAGLALRALVGLASARLRSGSAPDFQSYLTARYGTPLFDTFFGPYTEKLTGCAPSKLDVELALGAVPSSGLLRQLLHRLIGRTDPWDDFLYPRGGFMALPEGMARALARAGGRLALSHRVERLSPGRGGRPSRVEARSPHGTTALDADLVVSTIPLPALLRALDPPPPREAVEAASRLTTRALVTVYLAIARERLTEDHWIYVPDPTVAFCRLSETVNYSESMAPPGHTGVCAEIACRPGDALWGESDEEHARRTAGELVRLGLLRSPAEVVGSWVRRIPSAYPVYRIGYRRHLGVVESYLAELPGLRLCGRQGSFWYGSTAQGIRQGLDLVAGLGLRPAAAA